MGCLQSKNCEKCGVGARYYRHDEYTLMNCQIHTYRENRCKDCGIESGKDCGNCKHVWK